MTDIVKSAIEKGKTVLTLMRMRQIVFQTEKNYARAKIKSNVIMGTLRSDRIRDAYPQSTVASIDTIARRIIDPHPHIKELRKNVSLVIIDEAHNCTSESYARFLWWLEGEPLDFFSMARFHEKTDFKNKYLGFSATPFPVGKKTHRFFQAVIKNISPAQLRDQGFLVPARVFRPKERISRAGLKVDSRTGDYQNNKLFQRFADRKIVGDVVKMYLQHGNNGRAICFAINLEHSKMLAKQFCEKGVPAVHCDAGHSRAERDSAIAQLKRATIKVLCNVNIFSVGLDCPWLDVAICARPTASEILAVQQWGRVLRPYKICAACHSDVGGESVCFCGHEYFTNIKTDAIILDHANNSGEFGFPYDERTAAIDKGQIQEKKKTPIKDCPKCHMAMLASTPVCAACKFVFTTEKRESEISHEEGELSEVTDWANQFQILRQKIWKDYNALRRLEIIHGWHPYAKWHKMAKRYGHKLLPLEDELKIPRSWRLKIRKMKKPIAKTISE